jgi:predicted ATPase
MAADRRAPLVAEVRIRDFRTMRELTLGLEPVNALVGEAMAGKSNLLAALRAALGSSGKDPGPGDVRHGARELSIAARLTTGAWVTVAGRPPALARERAGAGPPVLFLPAGDRGGGVVDGPLDPRLERFGARLAAALGGPDGAAPAVPALCAVEAFEACCERRVTGALVLIEEPELYLRPQAQRFFARILRRLAAGGNQVVFSTQSPAFLNLARMEELVFVQRRDHAGTQALRPPPLTPDEDFRVLSEFDAERAELLFARAALLVEGATEKLAMPFVFAALGEDADREGISIVECGGKANLVLFARVCRNAGVPFAVLLDRDARPGHRPSAGNRALHDRIATIAGRAPMIELAPDFEAVARLRGSGHKPERAWRAFASLPADRMPGELVRAARATLALARAGQAPHGGRPGLSR